MPDVKLSATIV